MENTTIYSRILKWRRSAFTNDMMPITLLIMCLIILLVAVAAAIVSFKIYRANFPGGYVVERDAWGQFGDYFGGTLNPFFSLLSLLALLATLFLQSRELASSTKALEDQSALMKLQTFESMFLSMISLCSDSIKNIDLAEEEEGEFSGKRALRKLYERLKLVYTTERNNNPSMPEDQFIVYFYNIFYNKNEHHLGALVKTLQQIFVLIETRAEGNSDLYWMTLRAQLSIHELVIILYHSIAIQGFTSRTLLVHKKLFELVSDKDLLNPTLHKPFLT